MLVFPASVVDDVAECADDDGRGSCGSGMVGWEARVDDGIKTVASD